MKIYVASKYEEKERVREVQEQLRQAGHTITYDWTNNEQITTQQAENDFWGVVEAEALVLIAEKDLHYCGALVEFGIALGRGIPVYVLGSALDDRCIFLRLFRIHRSINYLLH
jgi:hypothetical protein